MQIHAIKESIKGQQIAMENQLAKIRDLNETLYKIDNVQIPALNTRLSQMMTRDEFVVFKKEHDQQVNLFSILFFFLSFKKNRKLDFVLIDF